MNTQGKAASRSKRLIRSSDPLALKRHLDRLLEEAGGQMSATVRAQLEAARKAALEEFVREESSSLRGSEGPDSVGSGGA